MDRTGAFGIFGDNASAMLSFLVFLAAGTLAFAVMIGVGAREAVRRRAARVGVVNDAAGGRRALRYSGLQAARKLIEYVTKHYSSVDNNDVKILRRRLVQAGIYDAHAPAYYFIGRIGLAVGLALIVFLGLPMFGFGGKASLWLFVMAAGGAGYLAPSFYIDRRISAKRLQHEMGFPDFMDLLVVCA